MKTAIYLYDADGKDRQIELSEVNTVGLHERQLLWLDVLCREEESVGEVVRTLGLSGIRIKSLINDKERPKIEVYENFFHFFIVSVVENDNRDVTRVPIDILVGKNYVVTIHDGEVGYFRDFREMEKGETTIGELDAESFIATLLDLHIVSYFRVLENIERHVDDLDERVLKKDLQTDNFLEQMVRLRQNVSKLRRWFLPHRDVFYSLSRPDFRRLSESDSAEHFILLNQHFESAFDAIESSRDTLLGLFDLYATKSAQTTNELVRRLTVITLIIGSLGVIAGIFGMNFEEDFLFKAHRGFWFAVTAMLGFAGVLAAWAKYRKWI